MPKKDDPLLKLGLQPIEEASRRGSLYELRCKFESCGASLTARPDRIVDGVFENVTFVVTSKDGTTFETDNPEQLERYLECVAGHPTGLAIPSARMSPPSMAEKALSVLVEPDRLEEAIGDFESGYLLLCARHGVAHARLWYWAQVAKMAALAVLNTAYRVAKAWSGLGPA